MVADPASTTSEANEGAAADIERQKRPLSDPVKVDAGDIAAAAAAAEAKRKAQHTQEAHDTARALWRAVEAAAGPQCYLTYHDGGYTNDKQSGDKQSGEAAGWGYQLQKLMLNARRDSPHLPVPISRELAHGPVDLDPDSKCFCGCLHNSNNTAELSAVPHILTRVLRERRRILTQAASIPTRVSSEHVQYLRSRAAVPETLILAYDSEYTRQMCDVSPDAPLPSSNATVISLCRRLLLEARDCGVHVCWVKVRGHSQAVPGERHTRDQQHLDDAAFATVIGNDWADWAATQGKNGGRKREQAVAAYVTDYVDNAAHVPRAIVARPHAPPTTLAPMRRRATAEVNAPTIAEAHQVATNRRASHVHRPLPPGEEDAPAQHAPAHDAPLTPRQPRVTPHSPPCTDVAASAPPPDSPTRGVTTSALDIARRNFYNEIYQLCFLGAISIGSDNCINPKMPRSELQQYDDGTIQTLIDSQTPIDTLF